MTLINRQDFVTVKSSRSDPYLRNVARVYSDDPELWRKVLGDSMFFHHGVYDGMDLSLEEAAERYLDAQIALANVPRPVDRILEIGCGWGPVLRSLARRFPECPTLDGINISESQLRWASRLIRDAGVADRVNLYLCNAQDIDLLPNPSRQYDLVILRGAIAHFTPEVLKQVHVLLRQRVKTGGIVLIAEILYLDPDTYASAIEDTVDRIACGYRKSPKQINDLLTANGFTVTDTRILPSIEDTIHWFTDIQRNIDRSFPEGPPTAVLQELHDVVSNMNVVLSTGQVAAFSIVARREEDVR
ncbi:SAM-dependent methyltransferase [Dyella sp.]|uniref:SAM-dependent methyltransferase n=1 Tax=Dyella sp. TaxID=1869338 RepID=UPI002B487A12|nr:class I SAM-dependent methyltransferase [Dyella sp.]HKT28521.1 class I SAM-dependent methyltransferase [Dyella sp.]